MENLNFTQAGALYVSDELTGNGGDIAVQLEFGAGVNGAEVEVFCSLGEGLTSGKIGSFRGAEAVKPFVIKDTPEGAKFQVTSTAAVVTAGVIM